MAYRDIEARRRYQRARYHRRTEARRAAGLCLKCGKTEPVPERTLCAPCAEKRNATDRAPLGQAARRGQAEKGPRAGEAVGPRACANSFHRG